jgi:hypothetical protein
MATGATLYQALQVDPAAEPEIVEAAYRRLAKMYHPDVPKARDAGGRMKEINAAYEVLRDPARRAAYDRQLRDQARAPSPPQARYEPQDVEDADEDWDEEEEDDDDEEEEGWVACHLHPTTPAAADCQDCGATLCEYCFHRFQPPSCPRCVLNWTTRRRALLLLPLIWFFGVLGLGGLFFLEVPADHEEGLNAFWIELACTYVLASLPTGWKIVGHEDADAETVALAAVLGPIVAPFRIAWIIAKFREAGRLQQLARSY